MSCSKSNDARRLGPYLYFSGDASFVKFINHFNALYRDDLLRGKVEFPFTCMLKMKASEFIHNLHH